MTDRQHELLSLFLKLAPIEGTSLAERAIADAVMRRLHSSGVRVVEDGSAALLKGTTGNLLCFPPDFDEHTPALMLTAHLDTVHSTASLRPIVHPDRVTSDGTTILGADDRLGLSVLVDLLIDVARSRTRHRNFFVVFTVGEEEGLYGASTLNVAQRPLKGAYVFDSSKRPGIYIRECVGLHVFKVHFIGKSAHSGVAPEEGINAIAMASKAVACLDLGRLDADTTANVGKIHGGEAVNAVPEHVFIEGEVRSFHPDRIRRELGRIERTIRGAVDGIGKVEFESAVDFEPYVLAPDAPVVLEVERALRKVGLTPQGIRYTGGSDANKYNAKGIPAVNIGTGAQKPHSHEEFFLLEDLFKTSELAHALICPID